MPVCPQLMLFTNPLDIAICIFSVLCYSPLRFMQYGVLLITPLAKFSRTSHSAMNQPIVTWFSEELKQNFDSQRLHFAIDTASQFSHSVVSDSLRPHESQHSRLPCLSPTPGVHPNSCLSSRWCHPVISSSVVPFSSCLQSFPASGSLPASGGQSTGASATASVLPMNIPDWFPLGWIGWISLQSKGLSRVFSNTTVQKHQFFGTQLSL